MTEAAENTNEFETAKRQQILDGARRCFLENGFDGASMNDIVKAAAVSKGTVYAYFPSKEKLFEALIFEDKRRQAEKITEIPNEYGPIRQVLFELGLRFTSLFKTEESIAYARMTIGVAGKFPEIGRTMYEAGPLYAIKRVAVFLEHKMDDGTLQRRNPEILASQFIDLVQSGIIKPIMFGIKKPEDRDGIEARVAAAVDLFLNGAASPTAWPDRMP
jgi:AcrR family transcriptional regulator